MAIKEHLQKLQEGPEAWNKWVEQYREENRKFLDEYTEDDDPIHFIDLSWAHLGEMNLSGVDLLGADLYMTKLNRTILRNAVLSEAHIHWRAPSNLMRTTRPPTSKTSPLRS